MIFRFKTSIIFEAADKKAAVYKLMDYFEKEFDVLFLNESFTKGTKPQFDYTGTIELEEEKINPEVDLKEYEG